MKIHKIDIKNIRGIPVLTIEPKGNSFVVYGPNGTGKSAVIDSIDFLLTGKIARLSGEGTEGLSLKKHGPHINAGNDLKEVEVSAEIEVPGISEKVIISRTMSNPNKIYFDEKYETKLATTLELLNRGQYVFTRREVLKLITAKSSTRAQEIQKVLKLTELEEIRGALRKVYGEIKNEYDRATFTLDKVKQDVIAITGHSTFELKELIVFVNKQRLSLGGLEIDNIHSSNLKEGLSGVQVNPASINHKSLIERINSLRTIKVNTISHGVQKASYSLIQTIKEIQNDPQANWNSKRYRFTKEGIQLIPDSGECPLCDKDWDKGVLHEYLQKRVDAESSRQSDISDKSNIIRIKAEELKTSIERLVTLIKPISSSKLALGSPNIKNCIEHLNNWTDSLSKLINATKNPVKDFIAEGFNSKGVNDLYLSVGNDDILDKFEEDIKSLFPKATPEQNAWDNLTKLTERLKILEEAQIQKDKKSIELEKAKTIGTSYVKARDVILDGLYDNIKSRFVSLYQEMHGEDEKDFSAVFSPKDAGLNLEVDFYGRGMHPPHALHSEGHQDSMGVCLFLALSEHLNEGIIDLTILDDVVMSVDIGHRRSFCKVLSNNFPNKQFIITTHDSTWANQLRGEGLVNRKQMLKFYDWNVDTGPRIHYEADMWARIEEDLSKDDISAASAKLRNGLEEFTRYVCHNLNARVPYRLDDGGSLGDFLPSAIGTYKELLSKAKKAANSWNRQEDLIRLKQIDEEATKIIKMASIEQWTINKTVHYNAWAQLSKEDFIPVVQAFRKLCDSVFACDVSGCESVLKVTYDGAKVNGVRCKCGNMNWNLIEKK